MLDRRRSCRQGRKHRAYPGLGSHVDRKGTLLYNVLSTSFLLRLSDLVVLKEKDSSSTIDPPDLELFSAWLKKKGLLPSSRWVIRARLRAFAQWYRKTTGKPLAPGEASMERFKAYWRATNYSDSTYRGRLASVRAYVQWAVATGQLATNPMEFAPGFVSWLRSRAYSSKRIREHHSTARDFITWLRATRESDVNLQHVRQSELEDYLQEMQREKGMQPHLVTRRYNRIMVFLERAGVEIKTLPLLEVTPDILRSLKVEAGRSRKALERRRLRGLVSLAEGRSVIWVAKKAGVSRWAVYKWARSLAEEHPEDVLYIPRRGAKRITRA